MSDWYQPLKALHIVAVVVLVAAMLTTAVALPGADAAALRRLRVWHRRVSTPALLAVLALGVTLAWSAGWFAAGWLQAKLVLVLALVLLHDAQRRRLRSGGGASLWPALAIVALATAIAVLAAAKP